MKFKKGDKVAVLDDVMKGIVISTKGNSVLIEEENGFELSFEANKLVKIYQDQTELSKFSDINNALLRQKINDNTGGRKHSRKLIKKVSTTVGQPIMEVDLHIQHLVKSSKGLTNFDMLNIQMDTAKHKLEFAIRKRIPRIVFIHGVGEGVLLKELEYLFAKYPVSITEASYQKYGMGATEVYILQNKANSY
jgi:hypothetical protein